MSEALATAEKIAARRRADLRLAIGVALFVWITRWSFPHESAAPVLDPSFQAALGRALVERMQFGVDIVYTYGPLGWFNSKPYDPDLYWIACIGWELMLGLVLAGFLAAAALRLRSRLALLAFAVLAVLPGAGFDAGAFLAIVAVAGWAIVSARGGRLLLALPLAVLAVLALVKFTYTLLVLGCVLAIAVAAARRERRRAVYVVVLFAALLVALWWSLGQSPLHLPAWFASSLEIVGAYGTSMSSSPPMEELAGAWLVGAAGVATLALCVRGAEDRVAARILGVVWSAALFLAFKAGFTRALGSQITFFGFAAAAPFLLPVPTRLSHRARRAFELCRASTAVLALAGLCYTAGTSPLGLARDLGGRVVANVRVAASLGEHERALEAQRVVLAHKYAMPRVSATVGDATVDVFGSEQAFVFLNDLRWHPRPVFQAFSALTDELSRRNARFLAGPDAPRFVLHCPDQIDARMAAMEDARSLQVLLRDYRAVRCERGMMLFERRDEAPRPDAREVLVERVLQTGETLELDGLAGEVLLLELDAHLDAIGRLRTLARGAPRLWIEMETSDGRTERARVVPEMMHGGALARPFLRDTDTWLRWMLGEDVPRIVRVRFVEESGGWSTPFVVRVVRADALIPIVEPERDLALRWSMFDRAPLRVESWNGTEHVTLRGYRSALVVDAPSAVVFTLAPGAHSLRAQYGFEPAAWRDGLTDGVIVRVERRGRDVGRAILWERALDPRRNPADGKLLTLALDVQTSDGDEIALTTDPGPAGDRRRDRVFWTDVSFTPLR